MFRSRPTLGGWLTMLNAICWPILFLLAPIFLAPTDRAVVPEFVTLAFVGLMVSLSFPVAWYFLVPPLDYQPTFWDQVQRCAIIGLNSLLWGYGLAAIWTWWTAKGKQSDSEPHRPVRGTVENTH